MDREAKMREVVRKVRDDRTYGCADLDSQEKYDNVVMEVELSPEASSGAAGVVTTHVGADRRPGKRICWGY